MNRQFYNLGGEGMQEDYQMQDEQSMQDNQDMMQASPQQMQAQPQAQPQMDPQQAIITIVKMLMDEGIPQEEAIRIAKQMIQAVAQGGMQEVSDENRVQARFGGRMGYASGGIGRLVDREQYGFGSIFKGITKGISGAVKGVANVVKKVASSDLGKMALMAAAIYAGGGGFGLSPGGFSLTGAPAFGSEAATSGLLGGGGQFGLGNSLLGNSLTQGINQLLPASFGSVGSVASSLVPSTGSLIAGGIGALGGAMSGGQPEQKPGESMEEYNARVEQWKTTLNANLQNTAGASGYQLPSSANNPYYGVRAANGGRISYQGGGIGNIISEATQEGFFSQPQMSMMAQGGRMGYAYGNSVQDGIMAAPQIANQMGMPVGNPRQNQSGVSELDYRDQGGFVPPIGIKEKEDDIPAMLSNNEFVFTADAVKNAGGGDPNVGAQKMYAMMKQLENGGMA